MARKKLPRLTSVRKLVEYAQHGAHGKDWYASVQDELAYRAWVHGVSVADYCDVLALTSPRVSVRRNVSLTEAYFSLPVFGDLTRGELPGAVSSVNAALRHWELTGEIRGPKTRAFSDALQGKPDPVVLDVWMARAFGIDQKLFKRKAVHEACTRRVRLAAERLGWTPAEVQAAVWTAWYEDLGRKGETNVVRLSAFLPEPYTNPARLA